MLLCKPAAYVRKELSTVPHEPVSSAVSVRASFGEKFASRDGEHNIIMSDIFVAAWRGQLQTLLRPFRNHL